MILGVAASGTDISVEVATTASQVSIFLFIHSRRIATVSYSFSLSYPRYPILGLLGSQWTPPNLKAALQRSTNKAGYNIIIFF